jgi:succinate dehydrogenase / fumarate reductase cytochrome b subunit
MIVSGSVVLHFGIAFYDFGFQKWCISDPLVEMTRYFHELVEKFESPIVPDYIPYHLLLSLHLWHGFSSSFVGFNNKYSRSLKVSDMLLQS